MKKEKKREIKADMHVQCERSTSTWALLNELEPQALPTRSQKSHAAHHHHHSHPLGPTSVLFTHNIPLGIADHDCSSSQATKSLVMVN